MLVGRKQSNLEAYRWRYKIMVITKDENNFFKLAGVPKRGRQLYFGDELVFNSKPGILGKKSKSATWKSVNVVVKYVERLA